MTGLENNERVIAEALNHTLNGAEFLGVSAEVMVTRGATTAVLDSFERRTGLAYEPDAVDQQIEKVSTITRRLIAQI